MYQAYSELKIAQKISRHRIPVNNIQEFNPDLTTLNNTKDKWVRMPVVLDTEPENKRTLSIHEPTIVMEKSPRNPIKLNNTLDRIDESAHSSSKTYTG